MVPEVIVGQAGILVGLAHIHRHPFPVRKEFRPAMIPVDAPIVPLRGDGGPNGKSRRDADGAYQGDEIGMEIRAIPGANIAGIYSVPASPSVSVFGISYLVDHVIIDR